MSRFFINHPVFAWVIAILISLCGVLAIFNSAAPLFSAVVAWLWLGDRMTPARIAGLAIGFAGVVGTALWILVVSIMLAMRADSATA